LSRCLGAECNLSRFSSSRIVFKKIQNGGAIVKSKITSGGSKWSVGVFSSICEYLNSRCSRHDKLYIKL